MDWDLTSNFAVAMIAAVNPLGNFLFFVDSTKKETKIVKSLVALLIAGTIFCLLIVFMLSGQAILDLFGITIAAFQITGGILILFVGISRIQLNKTDIFSENLQGSNLIKQCSTHQGIWEGVTACYARLLVPFAFPMLIGPGSISTVILYTCQAQDRLTFLGLIGAVLIVSIAVLLSLFLGMWFKHITNDVAISIIIRLFGILLAALGTQFIFSGFYLFFF